MCPKQSTNTDKVLEVIKEQISICSNAIITYNAQYYSSSVLCAIIAAAATVLNITQPNNGLINLFYILPTVFLASLYNLIKYTDRQLEIGAYKMVLEHLTNEYLERSILCWEMKIASGSSFAIYGGVVQIVFYLPVFFYLMYGFWMLNHNSLWVMVCFFISLQAILVIVMSIRLFRTKDRTLEKMGYSVYRGTLQKEADEHNRDK